ncbi:MAG TPA: hypothetical protein VGL22_19700 [Terracidiphilus sp.]|jgi:hypothetical protein
MDWTRILTPLGLTAIVGAAATYFFALLKDARDRLKKLESDLLKSRDEAYGQIWRLTGALNLFGPAHSINCSTLSGQLTDWYFSKGQMLTEDSKSRYFLVQEVLNLCSLRNIWPTRPSDKLLFSGDKRTIPILRELRTTRLRIPDRGDEGSYELTELETHFRHFKEKCNNSPEEIPQDDAWLLLQFLMSAFRSRVTNELGSRTVIKSRAKRKEARRDAP